MSEIVPKLSKKIEYSDRTKSDLEEIWFHIAEDGEEYANKVVAKIIEKFPNLLSFPKLGKERNEFYIGLRSIPSGKYIIFYQELDNGIEIVRVVHGARDIEQIFNDMIPPEQIN